MPLSAWILTNSLDSVSIDLPSLNPSSNSCRAKKAVLLEDALRIWRPRAFAREDYLHRRPRHENDSLTLHWKQKAKRAWNPTPKRPVAYLMLAARVAAVQFSERSGLGGGAVRRLLSTLLFQPQTVTPQKQYTPIEHLARGRLLVDSWSVFGQFRSKMTKSRPKTDRKPTQNWPSPGSRQASTPKKRGGSVAEIKVLRLLSDLISAVLAFDLWGWCWLWP